MRYCSGHNRKLPLEVDMSILVLFVFVVGIFIPSPLCADTKVYDKDWNLKERIDDSGRIYDKNYNLKGKIQDDKVYDKDWNLKGRIKK